ncbi:Cof-type HAD-IIB family hydrolase [Euzebya tangerina]|uniref:Cof-type HAD-IIB family hydrolase n=1 Tax=Euzebya tangerina TaxID=591198 RepID=UPI000E30C2CB|nr:Cof-type HAD-IIB family hydrolase [Euzebya tangerina]
MPTVIASDIDGTLLRSDRTVSDRTRAAVTAVEDAGMTFVLVTGRPPRWLAPVRDQMAHRGLAICANGALVMDLETEEVVTVNAFDPEDGLEVIDAIRSLSDGFGFGVEWPTGFAHESSYPRGVRQSEMVPNTKSDVTDDREFFEHPVIKILVRAEGHHMEHLAAQAVELTRGKATVTYSDLELLEISAAGVSKASALEAFVAQRDGAPEHVVAFGDMPNDLPMLRWAGSSVAVANAHPLVLDAADRTTASNDEDGVALVLEELAGA